MHTAHPLLRLPTAPLWILQRDRAPPKELTAPTLPCEVERIGVAMFGITLREGRNRQVRAVVTSDERLWALMNTDEH